MTKYTVSVESPCRALHTYIGVLYPEWVTFLSNFETFRGRNGYDQPEQSHSHVRTWITIDVSHLKNLRESQSRNGVDWMYAEGAPYVFNSKYLFLINP